jgi:hypothetical protein
MKIHRLLAPVLICGLFSNVVSGASLIKAEMLSDHGLAAEAKLELIEIIHTRSSDVDKASAYYQLGGIAFDENSISVALQSWTTLVDQYPSSPEAALVKEKINALSEVVGESAKQSVNNAVASSYLRHADFWSKSKSNKFTIDSSWIPSIAISASTSTIRQSHKDVLKILGFSSSHC